MARLIGVVVAVVVAAVVLASSSETALAAVSCGEVTNALLPCLGYAMGSAASPSAQCCTGVRGLNSRASSTADRQAACACLKNLAARFGSGGGMGNAASIPAKCGVNVGMAISPNVDCSKIN
ncbi:hypothetical protein U9M48_005559 [Paspalum notatum var. saurae]|uniref:Non-specific lipid-transfer protein n=1 Tax=Paspalum notatum var. saurae TaxID=547442 RepID=A0AAQ3PXY7_PASNO